MPWSCSGQAPVCRAVLWSPKCGEASVKWSQTRGDPRAEDVVAAMW